MNKFNETYNKIIINESMNVNIDLKQSLNGLWNSLKDCSDWIKNIEQQLTKFYPEYIADDRGITINSSSDFGKFYYNKQPFIIDVQILANPIFSNDQYNGEKTDANFLELIDLIKDLQFDNAKIKNIKYDLVNKKINISFTKIQMSQNKG